MEPAFLSDEDALVEPGPVVLGQERVARPFDPGLDLGGGHTGREPKPQDDPLAAGFVRADRLVQRERAAPVDEPAHVLREAGDVRATPVRPELVGRHAEAVAALLMVGTIAGIVVATFLNNSGGAWDNAKKFIETGALGGKGSATHKAAVVGDTVGDPFKDTAGPSLHVLIKLLATITLVLAPLFIETGDEPTAAEGGQNAPGVAQQVPETVQVP